MLLLNNWEPANTLFHKNVVVLIFHSQVNFTGINKCFRFGLNPRHRLVVIFSWAQFGLPKFKMCSLSALCQGSNIWSQEWFWDYPIFRFERNKAMFRCHHSSQTAHCQQKFSLLLRLLHVDLFLRPAKSTFSQVGDLWCIIQHFHMLTPNKSTAVTSCRLDWQFSKRRGEKDGSKKKAQWSWNVGISIIRLLDEKTYKHDRCMPS